MVQIIRKNPILYAIFLALVGCNSDLPVQNSESVSSSEASSSNSNIKDQKSELSYALATNTSPWLYVDLGWDVAAAWYSYWYIRNSDRAILGSTDGKTWVDYKFPVTVKAKRIAASNGTGGRNIGSDNLAALGEDGFIYVYSGSVWTKLANQGNFQDVIMENERVWGLGTDYKLYYAGSINQGPVAGSVFKPWLLNKVVAFVPDDGSYLVSNEYTQVFRRHDNKWEYQKATGVSDMCGVRRASAFGWDNIWITSTTGKLSYYYPYQPSGEWWTAWGADRVSRVGCSHGDKLIVVNFDRTTYIRIGQ